MVKKVLRLAVPGVVAVLGATGLFLSQGQKNCNDLVDLSNKAIDAANAAKTDAEVEALVPTLGRAADDIRKAAGDYGSPFDSDARASATALDAIRSAIEKRDGGAYDQAISQYNQTVDTTNKHCSDAR